MGRFASGGPHGLDPRGEQEVRAHTHSGAAPGQGMERTVPKASPEFIQPRGAGYGSDPGQDRTDEGLGQASPIRGKRVGKREDQGPRRCIPAAALGRSRSGGGAAQRGGGLCPGSSGCGRDRVRGARCPRKSLFRFCQADSTSASKAAIAAALVGGNAGVSIGERGRIAPGGDGRPVKPTRSYGDATAK